MPKMHEGTLITRIDTLPVRLVAGKTEPMRIEQSQYYGLTRTAPVIRQWLDQPWSPAGPGAERGRPHAGTAHTNAADASHPVDTMTAEAPVTLP